MFAKNLKKLRLEKQLTQKELAEKLDISSSAIGMYEQGRRDPDTDMLIKVSNLFSVSIDKILNNNVLTRDELNYKTKTVIGSRDIKITFPEGVYTEEDIRELENGINVVLKLHEDRKNKN